jgi:hypothetical protein
MSKHTPGKWVAVKKRVYIGDNPKDVGNEADAHLIAAAPEMLEVLKEMVGVFIWDDGAHDYMIGDYDVALGLAKSVIAKAEGA